MTISIVKLGTPRKHKTLRLGTVRRPPRGIRKEDYSKLDYYDVWLPILAPGLELMKFAHAATDEKAWSQFKRKYRTEMARPEPAMIINLLASMSHQTDFSLGCYCEDENHCHRSVLKELLAEKGAKLEN